MSLYVEVDIFWIRNITITIYSLVTVQCDNLCSTEHFIQLMMNNNTLTATLHCPDLTV